MPQTTRSKNLDLIRWLNYGHNNTAELLSSITNANYISKMATGDMPIDDVTARRIEEKAGLPTGWLDRDNIEIIKMSDIQSQIFSRVVNLPVSKQEALLSLLG